MRIQYAAQLRMLLKGARIVLVPIASAAVAGCGAAQSTVGIPASEPVQVTITVAAFDAPGQTSPSSLQLEVGEDAALAATALNALGQPVGSAVLTWGSTDTSVVTVDNGAVAAVGPGNAQIVASSNDVFATLPVVVTSPPQPPTTN